MIKKERGHIEMLKRRIGFLQFRVDHTPDKDLSFDKHELAALRWAVEKLEGGGLEEGGGKD